MSAWDSILSALTEHPKIYIIMHAKADGDCLGSTLALAYVLRSMGKNTIIPYNEELPETYQFMPGIEMINRLPKGPLNEELPVICVDSTDLNRSAYSFNNNRIIINIDHHISNKNFGSLNIVDSKAAATGEIIFKILQESNVLITPEMATDLYIAISTDTGMFTYSNVTAETMRISGELILAGANLDLIRKNLYEKKSLREIVVIKEALSNLTFSDDQTIISCYLGYDFMKENGLLNVDTDSLIGLIRATEGVEVALLFKELNPNEIKVSMRSKEYVDVNLLAQEFDGGGHSRAAGCTIKGNLHQVRMAVIAKTKTYIDKGQVI